MAIQDWLASVRSGRVQGARRTARRSSRSTTAADIRLLESRQFLSGTNIAPQLISVQVSMDPATATAQISGMVNDNQWATGYAIELDSDNDGQADHSQAITNQGFSFTTNGIAVGTTTISARVVETESGTGDILTSEWETATVASSSTGSGSGSGSGSGGSYGSGSGGSSGSGYSGSSSSGSGGGSGSSSSTGNPSGPPANPSPGPGTPITPRYSDAAMMIFSTHGQPHNFNLPVSPPGDYYADPQTATYTFTPYPWSVEENLNHGTVSELASGEWQYTPDSSYVGGDGFTLVATRPNGDVAVRLRINAYSMNSWASGLQSNYQAVVGHAIDFHSGADPEGDTVSIQIVSGPQHGSVTTSGNSVTYTPNDGYTGSDTFTYAVWDSMPKTGPGYLFANPSPATVDISVIDPISTGESTALTTTPYGGDSGTLTTYFVNQLDESDPDLVDARDAVVQAGEDAKTDFSCGQSAAIYDLENAILSIGNTYSDRIRSSSQTHALAMSGHETTFNNALTSAQNTAKAALNAADSQYAQNVSNLSTDPISDLSGSSSSLAPVQQSVSQFARTYVQQVATINSSYNDAVRSEGDQWGQSVNQKLTALISAVVQAGDALNDAIDDVHQSYETEIYDAADQYRLGLNQVASDRHAATESKHGNYLRDLRALRDDKEDVFSQFVDQHVDDVRPFFAAFYQSLAEYEDHVTQVDGLKQAMKDLQVGLAQARLDYFNQKATVESEFLSREQQLMTTMATEVAQRLHDLKLDEARALRTLQDAQSSAAKTRTDDSTTATNTHNRALISAQSAAATGLEQAQAQYASAVYSLGVVHDQELLNKRIAMGDGQINAIRSWISANGTGWFGGWFQTDATATLNGLGAVQTKLDATAALYNQKLGIDWAFTNSLSNAANTRVQAELQEGLAQANDTADAALTSATDSSNAVNDYYTTVNALDYTTFETSISADVALVTTIAGILSRENSSMLTAQHDALRTSLQTSLNELNSRSVDDFDVSQPWLVGSYSAAKIKFDISQAEAAFAPTSAPTPSGAFDPLPPLPPSPVDVEDIVLDAIPDTHALNTGPANDSAVNDDAGNVVGYIYRDSSGTVWVKRYVNDPNNQNIPHWFYQSYPAVQSTIASQGSSATSAYWDNYFLAGLRNDPEFPGGSTGGVASQGPDSIFDVMPTWMVQMIGGQAGSTTDVILNRTDQFFAGMSSTITGGMTDKIRSNVYGDIATRNQEGGFYTAGQIVGIAPAIAVSVYGGATTAHTGVLVNFSRTTVSATTIYAAVNSGVNIATGDATWTDALSFLPAVGAGTSRLLKWVQCFEGNTPVVVAEFDGGTPSTAVVETDVSDATAAWIVAGTVLVTCSMWPKSEVVRTVRRAARRKHELGLNGRRLSIALQA